MQPGSRTNGLAIASLVLGIVWGYGVGSILALVFGYTAKRQIRDAEGTQYGDGFATAGIVLGWLGLAALVLSIIVMEFVAASATASGY